MAFVSHSVDPNMMTPEQIEKIKDNYANMLIDGMDMDTLVSFAYDTIIHNMEAWDEEDLKEEVVDLYDEETWEDLTDATR